MRALVIGLDGATWDLLKPWAEERKLPAFGTLMAEGVWGELQSTIPPVSGPAWVSFATGKNPGKTGVIDFLNREGDGYSLEPVTANDFWGKSIWDRLGNKGKKVGVVGIPMLFPPYETSGFMVSNTAFYGKEAITFPGSLREKLDEVCGGYRDFVNYHEGKYDDTDLFLEDVDRVLNKQCASMCYLVGEPWDVLIYVLSVTDWVQHLMWKYIDASHPLYEVDASRKYAPKLLEFWQKIDALLGELIQAKGAVNFFIISDHGFGPHDECFNLAKWLEMKGYLIRNRSPRLFFTRAASKLFAQTRFGPKFKIGIRDRIDFGRSKAYVLGHTIPFGAIYINAEGRGPQACVKAREYETVKAQIIDDLKNLKNDIGRDADVEIFDSEEIYRGPYVKRAPDIIFTVDNWRCIVNEERFDGPLFENEPYSNRHTGTHRTNGIFLAYGPDIKQGGEITNAKIYDIAPTILHMFGVAIPSDIDGRVLKEIFEEGSRLAGREITYEEIEGEDGKEQIKARIKGLKDSGKI